MRKRFMGKRLAAALLAAAVAFSSGNFAGGYEYVYAAEASVFYTGTNTVTKDKLDLATEDWDNPLMITYDESIADCVTTKDFTMKADITLDDEAYASLGTGESYLKVQGIVKLGSEWTWTDSQDIPYLQQSSFSEDTHKTTITIKFEDKDADDLKGVYFRLIGQGFSGTCTFSNVTLSGVAEAQPELPAKDPSVIDDFESAETGSSAGWEQEGGWQYDNAVGISVAEFQGSKMLKADLDYTGCEGFTWSEAKIKKSFAEGLDVSAYNVLSYEMIYPEAFDGSFKAKIFAKNGADDVEIINKEAKIETSDLGDGYKKAVVTVKFSPNTAKITDLMIGTVGVSTAFLGSVYLDNLTLSQYNAAGDYTEITETAGEAVLADTSSMPEEVTLSDVNASGSAKALYAYLKGLDAADQVLFGHQNDTSKHVSTRDGVYSDTKDVTGSISGLVGIDSLALTGVELGIDNVDDAVQKSIEISKAAAAEGAIITLSTHMPNMSNEKIIATPDAARKYDFSQCDFSEAKDLSNNCSAEVLPGGKYNAQFTTYLDIIADYANGLGDIPVLFRPFHENTGGWFWWGAATTDKETYRALFQYTQDYLASKGVHNFIYVYSPNGPLTSEEEYMDRYPGDDCVDIVAFDYYDDYNTYPAEYSGEFVDNLKKTCQVVKNIADAKGKVAAISETGVRVMKADGSDNEGILVKGNPIAGHNWYKQVNQVAVDTGMPYFLLWANFGDTNFYVPYKYDDTHGQELINEFIEFYNEKSSVFANGTNFYGNADQKEVRNVNQGNAAGYFANVFSKMAITSAFTLKANVRNAQSVSFVLTNPDTNTEKTITAEKTEESGAYEGALSADILSALGTTDTGKISLVADGKTLVTVSYISFGKEKETLAKNVIENFELYYDDNDYLNGTFTENSAANCSSSFVLDKDHKAEGVYGGAFTYQLKTSGPEVWTGRMKGLSTNDYSEYNAVSMWVKPDGKGQKLVVQLVSGGEDFEVFLTDFVKTTEAKYVTIPFNKLKGKQNGTFDPKNVTKFAIWCNSISEDGNGVDIQSKIVFDDIRFVNVDESKLNMTEGGYVLTDQSLVSGGQKPGDTEKPGDTYKPGDTEKPGDTDKPGNTEKPGDTEKPGNTDKTTVAKVSGFKQSRATETSIRLTWKKVKKADGYQVYRYNKSTKKYQKVATVKTNTYTDKKLKTATVYQYKVRAYRKSGKKTVTGKYSNVIKAATSPQKVTAVKAKRVKSKVKLTWKKVKGADGYEIYRATSKKGKYQKIKTLKKGTIVSYTDGKAKKGKTYYYKVRAVKNAGKTSVKGTASNAVRCGK